MKELRKLRRSVNSRIRSGNRIYYVRYADDWVVGIEGERIFAEEIKDLINEFLANKLKLILSQEKTKITNLSRERAEFLGMRFWVQREKEARMVKKYNPRTKSAYKSRNNQVRV